MKTRLEKIIDLNLHSNEGERCFWWNDKWYTNGDLLKMTEACEKTLLQAGFTKGQRVAVLMANCPMLSALSLALWRLGGCICPLNIKSGMTSLLETLDLIDPFAVITADSLREEISILTNEKGYTCVTADPMGPLPDFRGKSSLFEDPDLAVIFATSGTTGLPKAVPLSHDNLYDNCIRVWEAVESLSAGDVFLTVLPNFHSFGYTVTILLPLIQKTMSAIVPGFLPPNQTVNAILKAKVNVIFGVPAVYSYLLAGIEKGTVPAETLKNTKILISGGDRLHSNLHDLALRLIGKDIMEGYGLTECSPVVAVNRSYETHRQGTVGPFIAGYEWRLRTEKGEDASGNEGVLWVKGPSVTSGYFHAPEMTAERFEDGWFNTGDYVHIEEDNYVKILDRVTDIIIVGGFNVYPQEVERVLHEHPAVRTAIVVGMPHPVNGEVPKAFIQKVDNAEVTDLQLVKYCKERLAHYKVPRKIEFVNEFPLSGTGKILRRVLRERERETTK